MKTRRSKAQWLTLIQEFEHSGLTQAEFCAQRGLEAKYFSLRRMKLKAQPEKGTFIQAVVGEPQSTGCITLHYGAVTLQVPAGASTQTLVKLVKALAA